MARAPYSVPLRWSVAEPTFAATEIARALSLPPIVGRCLVNRGLITAADAELFLTPRLKQLSDPFLLPDMTEAIAALLEAHARKDEVIIFGDYDVDGVTATAILLEVLEYYGWRATAYLPHRLEDGYGLNLESAERALAESKARLMVAVDCGSTSVEAITELSKRGIQVIVLDHHQLSSPLPPARALVNPQLGSSSHELCSAGLAFKLAHALTKRLRELNWPAAANYDLKNLLDLVALGTIADLVPLKSENRIFVSSGLKRLSDTPRPGLIALKNVAGIDGEVGVYEVGFQLAPRMNAAGRLEHAMEALDLLRAKNVADAEDIAARLDKQNRERQELEKQIADECLEGVRERFDPQNHFAIVEGNANWHVGVVGIVASRVLREFHRPTVIIGSDGVSWRGSGRSIDGFDLAAGLRECAHLLERHGGHAMAAGLSLAPDNFALFCERFNEVARTRLDALALQRTLRLDAEVKLGELTLSSITALNRLAPFGNSNPCVQVLVRNARLAGDVRRMGAEEQHARFSVADETGKLDVIWFNAGEVPNGTFDLAVIPELNFYNGTTRIQLKLQAIR